MQKGASRTKKKFLVLRKKLSLNPDGQLNFSKVIHFSKGQRGLKNKLLKNSNRNPTLKNV